jgi:hypothetical protein
MKSWLKTFMKRQTKENKRWVKEPDALNDAVLKCQEKYKELNEWGKEMHIRYLRRAVFGVSYDEFRRPSCMAYGGIERPSEIEKRIIEGMKNVDGGGI